jgi:hypothetical protein
MVNVYDDNNTSMSDKNKRQAGERRAVDVCLWSGDLSRINFYCNSAGLPDERRYSTGNEHDSDLGFWLGRPSVLGKVRSPYEHHSNQSSQSGAQLLRQKGS